SPSCGVLSPQLLIHRHVPHGSLYQLGERVVGGLAQQLVEAALERDPGRAECLESGEDGRRADVDGEDGRGHGRLFRSLAAFARRSCRLRPSASTQRTPATCVTLTGMPSTTSTLCRGSSLTIPKINSRSSECSRKGSPA